MNEGPPRYERYVAKRKTHLVMAPDDTETVCGRVDQPKVSVDREEVDCKQCKEISDGYGT